MTREHFDLHVGRLAVLRGIPDAIDEWWTACRTVAPEVFEAACDHALRSRSFFPVPSELLADCDAVKARVRPVQAAYPQIEELATPRQLEIPNPFGGEPLRIRITRRWNHDCETCGDTGWASRQCPESPCGRRFEHDAHEFVEKCVCIEWNPTIRRRKEAGQKYAAEKAA